MANRKRQVDDMTGIASRLRGVSSLVALAVVAVLASASAASAQQIATKAQVLSVVQNGDFVDVQLKVAVGNPLSSTVSNVFVIFADGLQVGLGDLAPGQTAVSQTQKQTINVAQRSSRNLSLPVTLKYRYKGQDVVEKDALYVRR